MTEGIQDLDFWERDRDYRALFGSGGVNFSFTQQTTALHTHKTQ